jgi:8-oxo-dGTP diphosphatase
MTAESEDKPKLLEPHKCEEWVWLDKDNLPKNIFLPIKNLLIQKDKFS